MLSTQELKTYAASLGLLATGVCKATVDSQLKEQLEKRRASFSLCSFEAEDIRHRIDPSKLMPNAQSVFVCLFPYYIEEKEPDNLSRYAMVSDYHRVAKVYLEKLATFIQEKEPNAWCLPLCDTSPMVDRWLAYQAGLGFFGKNQLLIHPTLGSWFFIGSLLLDIPLEPDVPLATTCDNCDACIRSCPGGALKEDFGFDCEKCVSYLTQKKELTESQKRVVHSQNSVYGCDVCQKVCPHNAVVPNTTIAEFHQGLVTKLEKNTLENMSNREFKKAYQNYAFSWCSRQTILKNFNE